MSVITLVTIATSASGDYDLLSTQLTFPNGSEDGAEMCASVAVNSDNLVEFEEDFTIALSLVTFGTSLNIGNNLSAVTLIDNDGMLWPSSYNNYYVSSKCFQLQHSLSPMYSVPWKVILR